MSKKILISIGFILIGCLVYGQVTFKKIYFTIAGLTFLPQEEANGDYDIWASSALIRTNKYGDIILQHNFRNGDGSDYFIPTVIKGQGNKYIITAGAGASCPTCLACSSYHRPINLTVVDSNSEVIATNDYSFAGNCFYTAISANSDKNGNILSCGQTLTLSSGDRPYLVKTDSMCNLIWGRKYLSPRIGTGVFIGQTFDGNYLMGFSIDSIGNVIMKTDTSGSTLWTKCLYNIPNAGLYNFIEDADSTILLYGATYNSGDTNNHYSFFVSRFTQDGDFIWGKSYNNGNSTGFSNQYCQLIRTSDNNYAIVTNDINNNSINTLIMKIDYNGDVLWAVSHGDATHDEYGNGIAEAKDHGFIFGGLVYGSYPGSSHNVNLQVIKTDSTGHAGCEEFNETISTAPYFIADSLFAPFPTFTDVTDTLGTVHDFGAGNIDTLNKCLFTNVKEQPTLTSLKMQNMVYPNPSKGKVTIKTNEIIKSSIPITYMTVYDSMGHIVLQKKISKEEDKQIDLAKQGKGIYVIEVNEGDKVSANKVVVE